MQTFAFFIASMKKLCTYVADKSCLGRLGRLEEYKKGGSEKWL